MLKNILELIKYTIIGLFKHGPHFFKYVKQQLQIDDMGEKGANDYIELANRCAETLNSTTNPDLYFETYDILMECFDGMIEFEEYVDFKPPGPAEEKRQIENMKYESVNALINRSFDAIDKESMRLKYHLRTDRIKRFFDDFEAYRDKMPIASYEYLQSLKCQKLISVPKPQVGIDALKDGYEFESYIADLLTRNGYKADATRKSGDQGADVMAEKGGVKFAIQCKLYSDNVGNKAVQEAIAGKLYFDAHVAVVATNSQFTKSAIELAEKAGVLLWDRDKILELESTAS